MFTLFSITCCGGILVLRKHILRSSIGGKWHVNNNKTKGFSCLDKHTHTRADTHRAYKLYSSIILTKWRRLTNSSFMLDSQVFFLLCERVSTLWRQSVCGDGHWSLKTECNWNLRWEWLCKSVKRPFVYISSTLSNLDLLGATLIIRLYC